MAKYASSAAVRRVARVLLVDDAQRILLFRTLLSRGERWIMPGGALEQGETHRQAALRELHEETGITGAVLGPYIWRRRFGFTHEGIVYDQRERYFVAQVASPSIDSSAWTAEERAIVQEWRWWRLPDIDASPDRFEPSRLSTLAAPILRGVYPARPVATGE